MATAGTEAEKPQDNASGKSLQGTVVVSGQITPEADLRKILSEVLEECRHVQHGVLRILSKDVRGHIGIFCGSYIQGAHVTTSREYGVPALTELLSANRGMYAFLSLSEQQVELKQSLSISIDELLNWRAHDGSPDDLPGLEKAASQLAGQSGRFDAISDTDLGNIQGDLLSSTTTTPTDKGAFLAWGGEMPVLASNLARLTPRFGAKRSDPGAKPTVEIERIPMPDDLDELAAAATAAQMSLQQSNFSPDQDNLELSSDNMADSALAPRAAWTPDQLNAIPTPVADPEALLGHEDDQESHRQVDEDIQRSLRTHRFDSINRSLSRTDRIAIGSTTPPEPTAATAPTARKQTQSDVELSALVSQRMQQMDPKSFIAEPTTKQTLHPTVEKPQSKMLLVAGGALGLLMALFLAHRSFEITTTTQHFSKGLEALQADNARLAISEFNEVIAHQPDSARGYYYRGMADLQAGDAKKAVNDYTKAISLDPKNVLNYVGRAAANVSLKNNDAAIADCEEGQKYKADCVDLYRIRAEAYANSGHYKDAIDDASFFLDATDNQPEANGRTEALAVRAFSYFKTKNFDHALKDYKAAIKLSPKNGSLFASRAALYCEKKDWRHALQDANTAATLDPANISVYQIRGACYQAQGNPVKALEELDVAVARVPSAESHRLRGMARFASRDFAGAMEDLDMVLKANPNDKEADAKYAVAKTAVEGPIKKAPQGAITADAVKPARITGSPSELVKRGYELMKQGSPGEAVEYLAAALKAEPNNVNARRYLAFALKEDGDNEGAIQQFSALATMGALTASSDKVAYGKVLEGSGKLETAITLFTSVIGTEPNNDNARIALVKAYLKAGFKEKAKDLASTGARTSRAPEAVAAYRTLLEDAQ